MPESNNRPLEFISFLLQGYPDVDDLVINSFSDTFVSSLAFTESNILSNTMSALARFVCHVQFFSNKVQAELVRTKRQFEAHKFLAIAQLDKVTDRTPTNVLMGRIYSSNPDLYKWESHIAELEEQVKYYDKLPDRIHEYLQVIKHELKRRDNGSY